MRPDIDRLAGAPYWAQVESLHQSYGEVLGITKAKEAVPSTANLLEALRVAQRAIGAYADGPLDEERAVLTEEVKIGCTSGLLQCLDRPHRLAYVIGEIFEWPAPEAAQAIGCEPAAIRKRLQRAREAVEAFSRAHCGLVANDAACACNKRVPAAVRFGRVQPSNLQFAGAGVSFAEARAFIERVEQAKTVLLVQQNADPYGPRRDFAQLITSVLDRDAN